MKYALDFAKSWADSCGNVNTLEDILQWVDYRNKTVEVSIKKIIPQPEDFWYYNQESGSILNRNSSFFEIKGLQQVRDGNVVSEQPVILQREIGYLGIVCKLINGRLNFLMQAKIEPGNINKIQISPTIQATKSNFTRKHGGKTPPYLDIFLEAEKHEIIVDQIQSEQASRFFHKRNRNIIIMIQDDIEVLPSHKWMTLGQIKALMKHENLVNMDTRTVLSCIPYSLGKYSSEELQKIGDCFSDASLFNSLFLYDSTDIPLLFRKLNNYKMFHEDDVIITRLDALKSWEFKGGEFVSRNKREFKVVFCDISMEGREVKQWSQPLFEAIGMATFGLFMCNDNGTKKFLVRVKGELGCHDMAELGPSVQLEPTTPLENCTDDLEKLFYKKLLENSGVKYNTILSEEGGRFYHEQNRNIIIEIEKSELEIPDDCMWATYRDLNILTQVNNCLNIQLRNLISLLEA